MSTDKLERIEVKIDSLHDRLHNVDTTLAAQHVSLKEHIRRTGILEGQIEPIKKHVAMVEGALKVIGGASILAAIIQLLKGAI